jgi:hypothetical protein
MTMETPIKPLRGMEIVRKLLEVKRQTQREAKENYRNNPEYRAIFERLKEKNRQNDEAKG